ncbi:MAG: YfhO family protein [Anaerolineales bacterium]|nr:YfhO family protein [Anaerolineales bacterium]
MFKRIFHLPYLPIVVAPLILFAPLLFTGKALFWGTPSLQFVPWWSWAWETILDGHLPLWNPLLGMGAPLIANYQSALFYPPYWIYFLFYAIGGLGVMTWAQALMVALHLIWGGLGMVSLVRRLGMGKLAQTVSGLAFSLSGYLVARAWFASINAAVAWLPWVLFFAFEAVQDRDRRSWLKLGVVIGMQLLAGHAQMAWYTLLLASLWVAYWSWQNTGVSDFRSLLEAAGDGDVSVRLRKSTRFFEKMRALFVSEIGLGLAALLGAALAVVQLCPTAVYLMQSQRSAAVDNEFALNYSFWPWRLLDLLAPGLFGSPVTGDYWGYGNFWEDAVYVGMLPILLAVGVLIRRMFRTNFVKVNDNRRSSVVGHRSFIFFLVILSFISFLLALGKNTPIFPWLYKHVPTFDMFQAPTRISIWAVYALALLAGIGAEKWRRPEGRGLYWTRLGTAGALAVTLGTGLAFCAMGEVSPNFIWATALAGFWALGAGVLALTAPEKDSMPRHRQHVWWSWAVTIWVAADLLVAGWGLNPGIDTTFYTRPAPAVEQVEEFIGEGRVYLPTDHEDTLKYERFLRFDTFDLEGEWDALRGTLLPNLNMLDGISSVNNFDPLVPGRYAQWIESLEKVDDATKEDLLDLMGVTFLEEVDAARGAGVRYVPREGAGRLRWVPCAVNAEDDTIALEKVFSGEVDFENKVILEGAGAPQTSVCTSARGQVRLEDENPNQIVISVEADQSGWVILSDVWYPGWRARVDGVPAPMLRANFLFRAVEVPEGEHNVWFEYRPVVFYLGAVVSVFAWCWILILAWKWKIFCIFLR